MKPWETIVCWYVQGNHHSKVFRWCALDFVHPQYDVVLPTAAEETPIPRRVMILIIYLHIWFDCLLVQFGFVWCLFVSFVSFGMVLCVSVCVCVCLS